MSIWKTLAAAIGGGIAVGVGMKLGDASGAGSKVGARLEALENRLGQLETPRLQDERRLETIIHAVSQLAQHSGEMERRIKDLDTRVTEQAAEASGELEQGLRRQLDLKFAELDATLTRHTEAIESLQGRATHTERSWQDLVSRMEQLCQSLSTHAAMEPADVVLPATGSTEPALETAEDNSVVMFKRRPEQKWRWRS
jgi:chromosome segregation ATPase